MKDISQRAKEYAHLSYPIRTEQEVASAYEEIAKKQCEVDILKASSWIRANAKKYHYYNCNSFDSNKMAEDFIEAMKGEL